MYAPAAIPIAVNHGSPTMIAKGEMNISSIPPRNFKIRLW